MASQETITKKLAMLEDLYNEGSAQAVSTGENWRAFLDFSVPFYNLSADNQFVLFKQKPDATKVCSFDAWGNYGKGCGKGTGLLVFSESGLNYKYLFDVSGTYNLRNRTEEQELLFQNDFWSVPADLSDDIKQRISDYVTAACAVEYNADEFENNAVSNDSLKQIASVSAEYVARKRLGLDVDGLDVACFDGLHEADLKTARYAATAAHFIAFNTIENVYEAILAYERGAENGRQWTGIQDGRFGLYTGSGSVRQNGGSGQVRLDENKLAEGREANYVRVAEDGAQLREESGGSEQQGNGNGAQVDRGDGRAEEGGNAGQEDEPDRVGGIHEHAAGSGRGDSEEGNSGGSAGTARRSLSVADFVAREVTPQKRFVNKSNDGQMSLFPDLDDLSEPAEDSGVDLSVLSSEEKGVRDLNASDRDINFVLRQLPLELREEFSELAYNFKNDTVSFSEFMSKTAEFTARYTIEELEGDGLLPDSPSDYHDHTSFSSMGLTVTKSDLNVPRVLNRKTVAWTNLANRILNMREAGELFAEGELEKAQEEQDRAAVAAQDTEGGNRGAAEGGEAEAGRESGEPLVFEPDYTPSLHAAQNTAGYQFDYSRYYADALPCRFEDRRKFWEKGIGSNLVYGNSYIVRPESINDFTMDTDYIKSLSVDEQAFLVLECAAGAMKRLEPGEHRFFDLLNCVVGVSSGDAQKSSAVLDKIFATVLDGRHETWASNLRETPFFEHYSVRDNAVFADRVEEFNAHFADAEVTNEVALNAMQYIAQNSVRIKEMIFNEGLFDLPEKEAVAKLKDHFGVTTSVGSGLINDGYFGSVVLDYGMRGMGLIIKHGFGDSAPSAEFSFAAVLGGFKLLVEEGRLVNDLPEKVTYYQVAGFHHESSDGFEYIGDPNGYYGSGMSVVEMSGYAPVPAMSDVDMLGSFTAQGFNFTDVNNANAFVEFLTKSRRRVAIVRAWDQAAKDFKSNNQPLGNDDAIFRAFDRVFSNGETLESVYGVEAAGVETEGLSEAEAVIAEREAVRAETEDVAAVVEDQDRAAGAAQDTEGAQAPGGVGSDELTALVQAYVDRFDGRYGDYNWCLNRMANDDRVIKDFYRETYPDDELGIELREGRTFTDLFNCLRTGIDVYEFLGIGDSVVRERVFGELTRANFVKYDDIYDLWLAKENSDERHAVVDRMSLDRNFYDEEGNVIDVSAVNAVWAPLFETEEPERDMSALMSGERVNNPSLEGNSAGSASEDLGGVGSGLNLHADMDAFEGVIKSGGDFEDALFAAYKGWYVPVQIESDSGDVTAGGRCFVKDKDSCEPVSIAVNKNDYFVDQVYSGTVVKDRFFFTDEGAATRFAELVREHGDDPRFVGTLLDFNASYTKYSPKDEYKLFDRITEALSVPLKGEGLDYVIPEEGFERGGPKARFNDNVAAIETLKRIEEEHRSATAEEQGVLARYMGWGGLAAAFDPSNESWKNEYTQLKELLTADEYDAALGSTVTAYYTPAEVVRSIYSTLDRLGFKGGNILDPSMGIGNFFGNMPEDMRKNSELFGIELDSLSGRIAKQLYQNANIRVTGYEETELGKGKFDVVVSNIPFGDILVNDPTYNKYKFKIHDYFFAKSLDMVRPGGIVAFVTSTGTLDKSNDFIRKYIAQRANLLGAVRLPHTTFKNEAQTDAAADVIFLQRREREVELSDSDMPDWVGLGSVKVKEAEKDRWGIYEINPARFDLINRYFVDNPQMLLGKPTLDGVKMGGVGDYVSFMPIQTSIPFAMQLEEAMGNIAGEYVPLEEKLQIGGNGGAEGDFEAEGISGRNVPNYSYCVIEDTGGGKHIAFREGSVYTNVDDKFKKPLDRNRVMDYIALRDEMREIIDLELSGAAKGAVMSRLENFSAQYDRFAEKYGRINSTVNRKVFDCDSGHYLMGSLEIYDENGKFESKSNFFTELTVRPEAEVPMNVANAEEALLYSLGSKLKIDMDFMSQIYGGRSEAEIVRELGESIFFDPVDNKYHTADDFLSGDILKKIRDTQQKRKEVVHDDIKEILDRNEEALRKVMPEPILAKDIDVRLGSYWVPEDIVKDFMVHLFTPYSDDARKLKVNYLECAGMWVVENKPKDPVDIVYSKYGFGDTGKSAYYLIEDILNLRDTKMYMTVKGNDGKDQRVFDSERTADAEAKKDLIRAEFADWIFKDAKRRQRIEQIYNERFNTIVPRKFNGDNLIFSGMSKDVKLMKHQKDAIARILFGGNTLLAHAVGAGKTFEMIAGIMEKKKHGLCKKPVMVVPKNLVEQTALEFMRLYPTAHILVADKKSFAKENRRKFTARLITGDFDCVIMSYQQFEAFAVSNERQIKMVDENIHELNVAIKLAEERGDRKSSSVKKLQAMLKNYKAKRLELFTRLKKKHDETTEFELTGIDSITCDEIHAYCLNLGTITKMGNVRGISTTASLRAEDMYLKCRYLNEITGGKGVVFATGTPVRNSMTEMYTIQRYLQYDLLKRRGMQFFDVWASTFGETKTVMELKPEGAGYQAVRRFSQFFNVPELMHMFRESADIQTPEMLAPYLSLPKCTFENVLAKRSPQQAEYMLHLADRADHLRKSGRKDLKRDNMLKLTGDGRKCGLDVRLLNEPFDRANAMELAIRKIARDVLAEDGVADADFERSGSATDMAEEIDFDLLQSEANRYGVCYTDYVDSKINLCVSNVLKIWTDTAEKKSTQVIFCDFSTPYTKDKFGYDRFNVYQDMKDKLINLGIPKEEIAFVHDTDNDKKKEELYEKVRNGQVRVIFGSTEKLGTGVNIQNKLVAAHHLDAPWRPSDLEQRNGRINRRNNENDEVKIFTYITEDTFDAYMFQTLENKQKFISQIMSGKGDVRRCEDCDEVTLQLATAKSLAISDPRVKDFMELTNDIANLSRKLAVFQKGKRDTNYSINVTLPEKIEKASNKISALSVNDNVVKKNTNIDNENHFSGLTLYKVGTKAGEEAQIDSVVTTKESARKAILSAQEFVFEFANRNRMWNIGQYRGHEVDMCWNSVKERFDVNLSCKDGMTLHADFGGIPAPGSVQINFVARMDNVLNALEKNIATEKSELEQMQKLREDSIASLDNKFPFLDELVSKVQRYRALKAEMGIKESGDSEITDDTLAEAGYEMPSEEAEAVVETTMSPEGGAMDAQPSEEEQLVADSYQLGQANSYIDMFSFADKKFAVREECRLLDYNSRKDLFEGEVDRDDFMRTGSPMLYCNPDPRAKNSFFVPICAKADEEDDKGEDLLVTGYCHNFPGYKDGLETIKFSDLEGMRFEVPLEKADQDRAAREGQYKKQYEKQYEDRAAVAAQDTEGEERGAAEGGEAEAGTKAVETVQEHLVRNDFRYRCTRMNELFEALRYSDIVDKFREGLAERDAAKAQNGFVVDEYVDPRNFWQDNPVYKVCYTVGTPRICNISVEPVEDMWLRVPESNVDVHKWEKVIPTSAAFTEYFPTKEDAESFIDKQMREIVALGIKGKEYEIRRNNSGVKLDDDILADWLSQPNTCADILEEARSYGGQYYYSIDEDNNSYHSDVLMSAAATCYTAYAVKKRNEAARAEKEDLER